jgi:hypothetical protein
MNKNGILNTEYGKRKTKNKTRKTKHEKQNTKNRKQARRRVTSFGKLPDESNNALSSILIDSRQVNLVTEHNQPFAHLRWPQYSISLNNSEKNTGEKR